MPTITIASIRMSPTTLIFMSWATAKLRGPEALSIYTNRYLLGAMLIYDLHFPSNHGRTSIGIQKLSKISWIKYDPGEYSYW